MTMSNYDVLLKKGGGELTDEGLDYAIDFESSHDAKNLTDLVMQLPEDMPWSIKGLIIEAWQSLLITPEYMESANGNPNP